MNPFRSAAIGNLRLRAKMLLLVLPLVLLPLFVVGGVVGWIANRQAAAGIDRVSRADLDHMAGFTIDLLNSHYQQFQVYREDKRQALRAELKILTDLACGLVESRYDQHSRGAVDLAAAKRAAGAALTQATIGETGYIYAMTGNGVLISHLAREGEDISDEQDEDGRFFIREMCEKARAAAPGEVLYTVYPWRNAVLGDSAPRQKIVAYRYFKPWDWIVAVGGYLEETSEDIGFEKRAFGDLKDRIKRKKVGATGYIYCMDSDGTLTVHPDAEGENIIAATDSAGARFIREMCREREGWIRYPWQNVGDPAPRPKIVRYRYFAPWDWIIAVGSYEDEFFAEQQHITGRIFTSLAFITVAVGLAAVLMVFLAAKVFTDPIGRMQGVIREVKRGRLDVEMPVESRDELGELAAAFNRMIAIIRHNREMEAKLAHQAKMASIGILSSGVAHEINNPLGIILGYAGYLEGKLDPHDPSYQYIHEIKRESKRCKKIVQDLLSYARTPKPRLEETDFNALLEQIIDFAANHVDMHGVRVIRDLDPDLPPVWVDGDQMRQVAINLILNAGAAMPDLGELSVTTRRQPDGAVTVSWRDTGGGIDSGELDKIFEPFYTTKPRGTGLGLAITRRIVEQHGGRIAIDSIPGEGTTVTVTLPAQKQVENRTEAQAAQQSSAAGRETVTETGMETEP
ncbi:MAG: cache domain-containing protein [Deltaproteobacteria bacterium]|nr:cache domain-containing protein [Candidatus Anaeroferrophillacea bacterium]